MKIAINIEHFSVVRGGAERYAFGLAKALSDKGHDVHILACSWHDGCEKDFTCHKIPVSFLRTFRDLNFARASQQETVKEKFDLCLSFGRSINPGFYLPHGGVHKAYLKRELQSYSNLLIKTLKKLSHSMSLRHFLINRIEKRVFENSNLVVVAISDMVKQDILSTYPFPEENIKIVYNGVDLDMFNPERGKEYGQEIRNRHSINDKELLVLFVANNFRLKGLDNLIRAAGLMKKKTNSFRLLVLGSGNKYPYQKMAEKLDCGENIIFAGSRGEMEKYYASADVLAQPTFYDACSLVTLESMASALPVVTTCHNGASKLVDDGGSGFVLNDPEDHVLLSEKLLLFSNRELKERMGKEARKKVESYSLERNSKAMLQLCEEVGKPQR